MAYYLKILKLEFIDIPTEQTTAATDAILAVFAIAAVLYLIQVRKIDRFKTALWICIFSLLALAAMLGTAVHGFKMSQSLRPFLWHILYLSLGQLVAFFVLAVVYDLWGKSLVKKVLPIIIAAGIGFFSITLIWPDRFLVFIIYELVAMLFALGGYIWLSIQHRLSGSWLMVFGVLITIIAAGVQAGNRVSFTFIWTFDYNGAYHLIQMPAILFLVAGLRRAINNPGKINMNSA